MEWTRLEKWSAAIGGFLGWLIVGIVGYFIGLLWLWIPERSSSPTSDTGLPFGPRFSAEAAEGRESLRYSRLMTRRSRDALPKALAEEISAERARVRQRLGYEPCGEYLGSKPDGSVRVCQVARKHSGHHS